MSLTTSTQSVQIVSGSVNVAFTAPNLFTYRLPAAGYKTMNDEVALKSLSIYYSFPNISQLKGNNTFGYYWNGVLFPVIVPDGIWSFADLNAYLSQLMYANGHYLIDSFGSTIFYINFVVNPVLYCISLTLTPVPSSLPAGWSNPANIALFGLTPQLSISSNVATLFGYAVGLYPAAPQSSVFQLNSAIPQITDVTSYNLLCNLVDNTGFSLSSSILASFVIPNNQQPGSIIQLTPFQLDWQGIFKQTTFNSITLTLVDQLFRPVQIRDPSGVVAILNLRAKK